MPSASTVKSEAPVTVVGGLPRPVVTIASPAQGEVWITGTQQRITWAGSNLRGSVQLELWRGDEQVDWLGGGPADARERVWDVCAWEPGDDYSFLLTAYECGRTTEFRGARFTILPSEQPPPTITVTSPNGGEVIGGGSHQVITWTSTNPRGNVWIDLMQGDNYWTSVGQAAMADGRFEWDVCRFGAPGSHRICVSHSECPYAVADESDSPITLTDVLPWPTVGGVAPSWSDVIQAGSTARIAWDVENPAGDVTISLLRGYWPYLDLGEAPMAAGGFDWQVCPWLEPGSNYRIALYMSACGEIHVVDEGLSFTIAGPGLPSADLDLDCDVDADDIDRFEPCATGPGIPYNLEFLPPGCLPNSVADAYLPADLDRDGDVDQEDFGILQRSLTEPPPG